MYRRCTGSTLTPVRHELNVRRASYNPTLAKTRRKQEVDVTNSAAKSFLDKNVVGTTLEKKEIFCFVNQIPVLIIIIMSLTSPSVLVGSTATNGTDILFNSSTLIDPTNNITDNMYNYDDDDGSVPMANTTIVLIVTSSLVFLLVTVLVCCFTNGRLITLIEDWVNSRASGELSDAAYGERALEVHRSEEEKKKEDPKEREGRLLDAFEKHSIAMVSTCGACFSTIVHFVENVFVLFAHDVSFLCDKQTLTESMFQPLKKDRSDSDLTKVTHVIESDSDCGSGSDSTDNDVDTDVEDASPPQNSQEDSNDSSCSSRDEKELESKERDTKTTVDTDIESNMNTDIEAGATDKDTKEEKSSVIQTDSSIQEGTNENSSKDSDVKKESLQAETLNNTTNAIDTPLDLECGLIFATKDEPKDTATDHDEETATKQSMLYSLDVDAGEVHLPNEKSFPNSCAICLCPYYPEERIVWSSNPDCPHAFHSECILEWLVKMQDGSPCPCCRREFVELDPRKGEGKKGITGDWSIRSAVRSVQASMQYSSLR